jgi:hypothetical protein
MQFHAAFIIYLHLRCLLVDRYTALFEALSCVFIGLTPRYWLFFDTMQCYMFIFMRNRLIAYKQQCYSYANTSSAQHYMTR